MRDRLISTLIALVAIFAFCAPLNAKPLNLIADTAPVNALLAAIVKGVQTSDPLIPVRQSVHDFALKPSDIRQLQSADLIVWLGPQASPALAKLMLDADFSGKALDLAKVLGINRIGLRKSGVFDDRPTRPALDPHMWLSPENAELWASAMQDVLVEQDPENAEIYRANTVRLLDEINAARTKVKALLAQAPVLPYVQFHDAYQYFEASFNLSPIGAATAEDEESTSLGILTDLRQELAKAGPACVFARDAQQAARALPLIEGTGAHPGRLDPLGRDLAPETYTYPNLLLSVAQGYADCFATKP